MFFHNIIFNIFSDSSPCFFTLLRSAQSGRSTISILLTNHITDYRVSIFPTSWRFFATFGTLKNCKWTEPEQNWNREDNFFWSQDYKVRESYFMSVCHICGQRFKRLKFVQKPFVLIDKHKKSNENSVQSTMKNEQCKM